MKTFKGGVHPPENKITEKIPISVMPVPDLVYVPLHQHTGKPARVLVNKKDEVKTGTVIGESTGFISSYIHSPVTGKVKDITLYNHPVANTKVETVVIEKTGEDQWERIKIEKPWDRLTPEEIVDIVKRAGIVGLGGAAFPTHVKLSPPKDKKIDTVIINGCECEPFLTSDHRLMLERPEDIIKGALLIKKAVGADKVYIGIENNKMDAVEIMKKEGEKYGIETVVLKTKYPQGAEKQLIKAITGKEVPSGGLPMDVGCLVQNVGTAVAIYEACSEGKPLIERVVTLTGGVNKPGNYLVRIGTLFKDVIDYGGGLKENVMKVINGGPMMGIAQRTLDVPVIKGTSGILALSSPKSKFAKKRKMMLHGPCIRCGRCVSVCPMNLLPANLSIYVENERYDLAEKYRILDCIECGSCAYICPSNRLIVQQIKIGKYEIFKQRRKNG